jgi:hypothetical protein
VSKGQNIATHSSDSDPPHPIIVLYQERKAREAAAAASPSVESATVSTAQDENEEKWITFELGDEGNCDGLECVAFFDDGSQMKGTFGTDNRVTFEGVSGNQVKRVELVIENPKSSGSITESLLKKLEDCGRG